LSTVLVTIPNPAAIALFSSPLAANKMMRARST
jgi:hypothetical protein